MDHTGDLDALLTTCTAALSEIITAHADMSHILDEGDARRTTIEAVMETAGQFAMRARSLTLAMIDAQHNVPLPAEDLQSGLQQAHNALTLCLLLSGPCPVGPDGPSTLTLLERGEQPFALPA